MAQSKTGKPLIYLSTPHSHIDPFVREERYMQAMRALNFFSSQGHVVFSPIVHSHIMAEKCSMPKVFSFWEEIDKTFIDHCDELWVAMIQGWETSRGMREEIDYATSTGKPVRYFLAQRVTDVGWTWVEMFASESDPLLMRK